MTKEIVAKYDNLRLVDDKKVAFKIDAALFDNDPDVLLAVPEVEFIIRTMSQEIRGKADRITGIFESEDIIVDIPALDGDVNEFAVDISVKDAETTTETQIFVNISKIMEGLRGRVKQLQLRLKADADKQRQAVDTQRKQDHDKLQREANEKREHKRIIERALDDVFKYYQRAQVDWDSLTCDRCDCKRCTDAHDNNERYDRDVEDGWKTIKNPKNINHEIVQQKFLEMVGKNNESRCYRALMELKSAEWYKELLMKIANVIPELILSKFKDIEKNPDSPTAVEIAAEKDPEAFFKYIELFEFYPWAEQIALKAAKINHEDALKAFEKYKLQPWAISVKDVAEKAKLK